LEFKSRDKGLPVALSQRGDGIKVRHVPFRNYCLGKGLDDDELLYVLCEVPNEHKEEFSKYVCAVGEEVFGGFKAIVDEVRKYFDLAAEPVAPAPSLSQA
jgi:hypothetical protein